MLLIEDPKKVKLKGNQLLITLNRYEKDFKTKNGLIVFPKGMMKNYQKVISIGGIVERTGDIHVGDTVFLNQGGFAKIAHEWESTEYKKAHKDFANDAVADVEALKDKMSMVYMFDELYIDGKMYALIYDQDVKCIIDDPKELEYAPC